MGCLLIHTNEWKLVRSINLILYLMIAQTIITSKECHFEHKDYVNQRMSCWSLAVLLYQHIVSYAAKIVLFLHIPHVIYP